MSSAADRKNQLVWDQIESGHFKQALLLINKRLKKGEKSEYLIVGFLAGIPGVRPLTMLPKVPNVFFYA